MKTTVLLTVLALVAPVAANAQPIQIDITGLFSTGTLNGQAFASPFDLRLIGDNSNVTQIDSFTNAIDPLISATFITPTTSSVIQIPTRFGENKGAIPGRDAFFFSNAGVNGYDLFDFTVIKALGDSFNYQPGFVAPGSDPGAQFVNVPTSNGLLTLTNASDFVLTTSASNVVAPVPETQTWLMMLLGFTGLAGMVRYRSGKTVSAIAA